MGSLSCLNVSGGDIAISFDTADAAEALRARRIIKDMLRRGYALLIKVDGAYQRALEFDESRGEYVIADYDPTAEKPEQEKKVNERQAKTESAPQPTKSPGKGRGGRRRLAMEKTDAVAVARSAGG